MAFELEWYQKHYSPEVMAERRQNIEKVRHEAKLLIEVMDKVDELLDDVVDPESAKAFDEKVEALYEDYKDNFEFLECREEEEK